MTDAEPQCVWFETSSLNSRMLAQLLRFEPMARLNNTVSDTSIGVLATAVVFGERVLFPMLKIVAAMLKSFVNSLDVP